MPTSRDMEDRSVSSVRPPFVEGQSGAPTSVPSPEDLERTQRAVEEQLRAGEPGAAASQLRSLRLPDRARLISGLHEDDQRALFEALSTSDIAGIIEEMDVGDAVRAAVNIAADRLPEVFDDTAPDVAADVLRSIDWDVASRVLAGMRDRRSVGAVLVYADEHAGGLMTPRVAALRDGVTANRALATLRGLPYPREALQQVFVVDGDNVLVGRLNLPDLVFAPPGRQVADIMDRNVVKVGTGTDQEECARLMTRYGIRSLPVVDRAGHLEGAIAIEDLVDVAEAEATEDMFKMFGLGAEAGISGPLWGSIRSRFPWLMVNLGTVLLSGFLLSLYSSTIEKSAILAAFVPVVAGQAGIAGTQTLTLIVRALALGEIGDRDFRRLLAREGGLATVQGVVMALALGALVWAWRADLYLGLVVAGALLVNLIVAALGGVLVPLGMRAVRIDPAAASAVVVTTLTDGVGIVVYLSLATAFLTAFRAA